MSTEKKLEATQNHPGGAMTREQLEEMEKKEKTRSEKICDFLITLLPLFGSLTATLEYLYVPNKLKNPNPQTYLIFLMIPTVIYLCSLILAFIKAVKKDFKLYQKLRYKAPLYFVIFILLTIFDYLTLKTGYLMYPFIPCVNDILNIAIQDHAQLIKNTLYSLRLLFLGYFSGAATGLLTGIACGYSKRIRYWVDPLIKVLGPIPPSTWLPLVMILASSLFHGSIFIIALGVWFAVTVASMTGISNIDKDYLEAARTLGASELQLVFRVAIPNAMPSILQGMTQGMSSACTYLMIAEMLGVEAGLGWYITWAKAWAAYNKMFAAIVVICLVFTAVTKTLTIIKKRVLRWQTGMVR